MRPRISAALIVRNEAHFLPDCLASIAGAVDEIVVVDTGSVDATITIAQRFGARILRHEWSGDFSAARNLGLDAASSEWILYIDADERLSVPDGRSLTDALSAPDVFAGRPLFYPRLKSTPYRELRLFRNDSRLRFSHAMHETIVPALDELMTSMNVRCVDVDATIMHLGYEGDLAKKHERNLPLLRAAVERTPDRIYFWHHLAETLAAIGDFDAAIEACRQGLDRARAKQARGVANAGAPLYLSYAGILRTQGEPCLEVIEEGLRACPDNRGLLFLKGRELLDQGRHAEAIGIANRLRFEDGPAFVDREMSFDIRIFGAYAHELAGVALLRMGRRADAAAAFQLAADAEPADPSYRLKAVALANPSER